MTARFLQNPWRLLLAINAAIIVGVLVHKIQLPPYVPYIHLLVDYHFGFIKRALIGTIVALFTDKVPLWLVFALGGATWLVTLGLYARLFQTTFGFTAKTLPTFVFIAGSPFFLKNFMHTLGHFDIYGCALAIILLLVPAGSLLFVALAALFSSVLVLIHHIHLLMYVPAVITIVVIRHYLTHGCDRTNVAFGIIALVAVSALFFAAQFWGTMPVPEADFVADLKSRMADPARADLLQFAYIWYQPLAKEISDTWGRLPHNILGVPVFVLLIWLHNTAMALFCKPYRCARKRHASPSRGRGACRRQPRLSRDVRDGVRLFALDLELGRLHVPDPARDEDAARSSRDAADSGGRSEDKYLWPDRHTDPARRNRAAVLISRSPDPHVKRALAAMADAGFLEPHDEGAEFRQAQPFRHLTAQHAAFAAASALAGDHEHKGQAVMVGAVQEAAQRAVGTHLGHAVQIEPRLDLAAPARQLCALALAERRQRRHRRLRCARCRGSGNRTWRRRKPGGGRCRRRLGAWCSLRLRRTMLSQRLDLLCDRIPQRALFLTQRATARRGTRLQHGRTGRSLHCCRWERFFTGRRGS
ncbi:hypothetical protein ACVWXL_007475 [Bradyrhizobium sp. GM22.5]